MEKWEKTSAEAQFYTVGYPTHKKSEVYIRKATGIDTPPVTSHQQATEQKKNIGRWMTELELESSGFPLSKRLV